MGVRFVQTVLERPRRALAAALLLTAVAAFAASQLEPSAPPSLLAEDGSAVAQATRDLERSFGAEPIVVVASGALTDTIAPANLGALLRIEQRVGRLSGVRTVFGPGTFVAQTVEQINRVFVRELGEPAKRADRAARRAAAAARRAGASPAQAQQAGESARLRALGPLREQYSQLFVRFGYIGIPSLANRAFVQALVLASGRLEPKPRFAWLFPDARHALILVRLRAGLSDARVRAIGDRIESITSQARLTGVETTVAGAPLVTAGITKELSDELLRVAPVVIVAMVLALLAVLGLRRRAFHLLLPAGGAVLATAALSEPLGLGLTPATVAALPVILGLGLDYAVQLQARYWGERTAGADPRAAALAAVQRLGPTLLLAGGSMAAGFLALTLSPVPLVDRLGLLLALGIGCCLLTVLAFGPPLLCRAGPPGDRAAAPHPAAALARAARPRRPHRGAHGRRRRRPGGQRPDGGRVGPREARAVRHAGAGAGRGPRARPRHQRAAARRDRRRATSPTRRSSTWMNDLEQRVLALDARLRPGPNLAGILATGGGGTVPDRERVQRLLEVVPQYFVAAVLNRDRTLAELSFGIPLLPAERAGTPDRPHPAAAGRRAGRGSRRARRPRGARGLERRRAAGRPPVAAAGRGAGHLPDPSGGDPQLGAGRRPARPRVARRRRVSRS